MEGDVTILAEQQLGPITGLSAALTNEAVGTSGGEFWLGLVWSGLVRFGQDW